MEIGLLVIDMQNDFCRPSGRLYVPGAEEDGGRLARLIAARSKDIGRIVLTRDAHQVMDIGHTLFWKDREGCTPAPFTVVRAIDVESGRWQPFIKKEQVLTYLQRLEAETGKMHIVWPLHCIAGSEGAAILPRVMREVKAWAARGHYFRIEEKGTYPLAEHYGVFRAEITLQEAPVTWFNISLLYELETWNAIWVAGEARNCCVASTLKQLLAFPALVKKLVIIEDCMSDVPGMGEEAEKIYGQVRDMGARFVTSEQLRTEK